MKHRFKCYLLIRLRNVLLYGWLRRESPERSFNRCVQCQRYYVFLDADRRERANRLIAVERIHVTDFKVSEWIAPACVIKYYRTEGCIACVARRYTPPPPDDE